MANKSILLVEDDRAIREILELKLQKMGFSVFATEDGEQAIETLKNKRFDLILMDLIMPKMNGFDLLGKLHDVDNKTPKIVMSNLDATEDQQKVIDLGAITLLSKFELSISGIADYVKNYFADKK